MAVQEFRVTLQKKAYLTPDMMTLVFSKPAEFDYQAGQFVQFLVPDGEKTVPRAYSLCSTPQDDFLEFCVKILPDGKASQYFVAANDGDEMTMKGPLGRFVHDGEGPIDCIATGAGIAPMIGLIRDELENKANTEAIHLLFGVRHKADLFWQERLQELADKYDNFDFVTTLSRGGDDDSWEGLCGRVTEHVRTEPIDKHYYLCGSPQMVKDVRDILLEAGADKKMIHLEIF